MKDTWQPIYNSDWSNQEKTVAKKQAPKKDNKDKDKGKKPASDTAHKSKGKP